MADNNDANNNRNSVLIRKIIHACSLHKDQHDSGKIDIRGDHSMGNGEQDHNEDEDGPKDICRKELRSLADVLPKFEDSFFQKESIETSAKLGVLQDDILNLCQVKLMIFHVINFCILTNFINYIITS